MPNPIITKVGRSQYPRRDIRMPGFYGQEWIQRNVATTKTLTGEFASFVAEPIVIVEFGFDSTPKYISAKGLRFNTQNYEAKLLSIGSIRRAVQKNLGLFEINSLEIVVDDTDRIFSSTPGSVKNSIVTVRIGTAGLGLDSYMTIFKGFIDDYTIQDFTVTYTVKEALINISDYPNTGFVDVTNFPNAFNEHRNLPLPVCYGEHSVTSDDDNRNRGAWPTLYIDNTTNAKKFLIACHAVKAINEVYCNRPSFGSTLLVLTTDYTVFPAGTINGQTMAWIQFTDAQFTSKVVDTGGVVGQVVCNVQGKETNANGTGTLMTNPVDVLKDFLTLYCGQPEIDATTFAIARQTAAERYYVVSGGYTEKTLTANVISDIAKTFNLLIYGTRNNAVAVDLFSSSSLGSSVVIDEARDIIKGSWSIDHQNNIEGAQDATIINSAQYTYKYHRAQQKYFKSDTFNNSESVSNYGEKKVLLEMPWSADPTTVFDVISRIIFQFKDPSNQVNFTVGLKGLLLDIANNVAINHANGPAGVAWNGQVCQIREQTFNLSNFLTTMRAIDIVELYRRAYILGDESAWVRVADGTVAVVNGSANIDSTGATSFVTAGVQVGDIIRLKTVANETNRLNLKVLSVASATRVTTSQTVWTNESSIGYEIIRSWTTGNAAQRHYGHLCNESTGQFSDLVEGFRML